MMDRMLARPVDDATVVVVRRTPELTSAPATDLAPGPLVTAGERSVVLSLSGRFDAFVALSLDDRIEAALRAGTVVLIADRRAVTDMDSRGMACLVRGLKMAVQAGGCMGLVGPKERIRSKLQMHALDRLLRVYNSVEAASAAPDCEQASELAT
jgi:anti-sigma B factor antagonist